MARCAGVPFQDLRCHVVRRSNLRFADDSSCSVAVAPKVAELSHSLVLALVGEKHIFGLDVTVKDGASCK